MIVLNKNYELLFKTKELIEFFNKLEKDLEYPNCEGEADKKRILKNAEIELIKWGII